MLLVFLLNFKNQIMFIAVLLGSAFLFSTVHFYFLFFLSIQQFTFIDISTLPHELDVNSSVLIWIVACSFSD